MLKTQRLFLTFFAALTCLDSSSAIGPARALSPFPHWVGEWEVSDALCQALGFDADGRHDSFTFPSSFRLSFDASVGENAEHYHQLFKKIDHEITATGKWQTDPDDTGIKNVDCVLTIHQGRTFLWVTGVPFTAVYGGKISYLEGVDLDHDYIVIDFNTLPKHLSGQVRAAQSVAYQRATKQSKGRNGKRLAEKDQEFG